ncbi:hypothetical protein [Clostridium grantii]|uniref:Uncharacterized protein n=1 Tax=Clostridium grantii DSM 8605 TaxID=1121316 RepID=A0A1M5U4A4_9CLOT|nr:hypothetical protein [Clostridium grantii]SHH57784.1 hypothetical protein SAMN02745207_01569 [Clostridium grantii DSM 8605]
MIYEKEEFKDVIANISSRELDILILDAKYTSDFNFRMKNLTKEIMGEGKLNIELSVIFNTEGEIALIDETIIGKYISDAYAIKICKYYKTKDIQLLIEKIIESNEKSKEDFIKISYYILYETMEEIFESVKYKKELINHYGQYFGIKDYEKEDKSIILVILSILYDINKFLNFDRNTLGILSKIILSK